MFFENGILLLPYSRHLTIADVVKAFVQNRMSIESYKQEINNANIYSHLEYKSKLSSAQAMSGVLKLK